MISGSPTVYDRVRPALEVIGERLFYVSEKQGMAQVMKLVNNVCALSYIGTVMEACTFGTKAGLDPQTMLKVINSATGRSGVLVVTLAEGTRHGTHRSPHPSTR